eukprot:XP_027328629.1 translation initiation factor IF-2-like isoform X8 [Anas platyrhynchos]
MAAGSSRRGPARPEPPPAAGAGPGHQEGLHLGDRTALGSEARQGGHGHDARGCWGRHQHASARREYARLDGRTRCRTGQDGGPGGGKGPGCPQGGGKGCPQQGGGSSRRSPGGCGVGGFGLSSWEQAVLGGHGTAPCPPPGPGVPQGYTPLHIAALHGHRQIVELLVERFGAKQNLRDYSGHLAGHYLGSVGTLDGDPDTPQLPWAGVSAAGTGGWAACCCPRPAGPRGAAGARPRTSRSRRKSEPQRSSSRPPRPTGPSASSPASTAPAPRCRGGLGAQDRRRGRALPGSAVKLRVHRVPAAVPVCAVPLGPWPRVGLGSTAPHSAPARGGSAQGWGGPAVGAGHTAAVPCRPLPHGSWCGG